MEQNKTLTSRRGFIVVAMGHAIGIGNIWRFSRGVIANGGGAFMVAYFVALLIWSMPLIMAEEMLVGKTRKGTVEAFGHAAGESYTWVGG